MGVIQGRVMSDRATLLEWYLDNGISSICLPMMGFQGDYKERHKFYRWIRGTYPGTPVHLLSNGVKDDLNQYLGENVSVDTGLPFTAAQQGIELTDDMKFEDRPHGLKWHKPLNDEQLKLAEKNVRVFRSWTK